MHGLSDINRETFRARSSHASRRCATMTTTYECSTVSETRDRDDRFRGQRWFVVLLTALAVSLFCMPALADNGDDDTYGQSGEAGSAGADSLDTDQEEDEEILRAMHPELFQGGSDTGRGQGGTGIGEEEWHPEFHPIYRIDHVRDQDIASWTHDFVLAYPLSRTISFRATSNINTRENDALSRASRQEVWSAGLDVNVTDAVTTGLKFRRNLHRDIQNEGSPNEVVSQREKETVNLTTSYRKTHFNGVAVTLGASAGLEKNEYSNVKSRGSTQGITATLGYSPTTELSTDFTYAGNHSLLDSEQGDVESTDESYSHTLTSKIEYAWSEHDLTVDLRRSVGTDEYPKQGETEIREHNTEGTRVSTNLKLMEGLDARLGFDYSRNRTNYEVEATRNNDITSRGVNAQLTYDFADAQFKANIKSERKRSVYFDVQTGDTYADALTADLTRRFGADVNVALRGRMSLLSIHYDDTEANDQDRDLFNREASITVDYRTVAQINTGLVIRVKEDQLIYIRRTRTGDNKTTQRYSVEPFVTKSFGPRFNATQRYSLSADYTFYDFDTDANFLVRNMSVTSSINWRPFEPLSIDVSHTYRTQDEGSYIEDEAGNEAYGRSSERATQNLTVGVRYTIAEKIDIEVQNEFGVQEKWNITPDGKVPVWDTYDTSIVGKASTEYSLDDGTTIKATVARTHRDATSISDRQREVWNITLNLNRTF
jgi:hypothetical protein